MARNPDAFDSSTLQPYLNSIASSQTLSNKEEAKLAARIRRGDTSAVAELVGANLRFVVNVARSYQNQGLPLADLINEGNMGMIRAARRFDERKNFRFITYAVWWIRQSILKALAENSRVVKLPLNRVGSLCKINRAQNRLEQRLGRAPAPDEIGRECGMSVREVTETLRAGAASLSLDAPMQDDEAACLADCLLDDRQALPDDDLEKSSDAKLLEHTLSQLDERERDILRLYYGMDGGQPYSLDEIGEQLSMTRERARQIKQRALSRLRRAAPLLLAYPNASRPSCTRSRRR
jgi:RNA polymerase primary sigma factor